MVVAGCAGKSVSRSPAQESDITAVATKSAEKEFWDGIRWVRVTSHELTIPSVMPFLQKMNEIGINEKMSVPNEQVAMAKLLAYLKAGEVLEEGDSYFFKKASELTSKLIGEVALFLGGKARGVFTSKGLLGIQFAGKEVRRAGRIAASELNEAGKFDPETLEGLGAFLEKTNTILTRPPVTRGARTHLPKRKPAAPAH